MEFFIVFTIKIKFAPTFTIIFVISASKYVSIHNFERNGCNHFSKFYPNFLHRVVKRKDFCTVFRKRSYLLRLYILIIIDR